MRVGWVWEESVGVSQYSSGREVGRIAVPDALYVLLYYGGSYWLRYITDGSLIHAERRGSNSLQERNGQRFHANRA
jgi:hypothetical protein